MPLPSTICPSVGPSLITRVTRLYNGTVADSLHELLQNARRAGATSIEIDVDTEGGEPTLVVTDDGCGIDDPSHLLTLGQSGWDAQIAEREDPAGMGVFSLAGRKVTIASWSASAARAWQVTIPGEGWEGGLDLAIEPAQIGAGTQIRVTLSESWAKQLDLAVSGVARHYPLPVSFRGRDIERKDFLAGACHIEHWRGCRIGVFHGSSSYSPRDEPRVNFHGLTVPMQAPRVQEIGSRSVWSARVDIEDAPTLHLVLPARKEMVENEALEALRHEMEAAIYRAIAAKGAHRLGFKDWQRARDLGVELAEATAWLNGWEPLTADNNTHVLGERLLGVQMILVRGSDADLEQAAALVIGDGTVLGACPVASVPEFAGYGWYDKLPCITGIDITFEQRGRAWSYGDGADSFLPANVVSGKVASLMLELSVLAPDAEEPEVRTFDLAMMVANNDGYCLDDAVILMSETAEIEPGTLAALMEASLFCASDDGDCDSWETQNDSFSRKARNLANTLLLGEDEALLAQLRTEAWDHLLWLIPKGRRLVLSAANDAVDLRLDWLDAC